MHGDMVTLAAQYLADSRCVGSSGQKKSVSTQEIRRYPMKPTGGFNHAVFIPLFL